MKATRSGKIDPEHRRRPVEPSQVEPPVDQVAQDRERGGGVFQPVEPGTRALEARAKAILTPHSQIARGTEIVLRLHASACERGRRSGRSGLDLVGVRGVPCLFLPLRLALGRGIRPYLQEAARGRRRTAPAERGRHGLRPRSGFGRALIYFAKGYRVRAIGAEVDPLRREISVRSARRRGVSTNVTVLRMNLLDVDLHDARKGVLLPLPAPDEEAPGEGGKGDAPRLLVVSVEHRFPDWKPIESREDVHLYVVPTPEGSA